MNDELIYQISLTSIPSISAVSAKTLVTHCGSAAAIFNASKKELAAIEGIGMVRAREIKAFIDHDASEKEMQFLEQHQIQTLFLTDAAYPQRLLHCYDPPTLLYYKGLASLNTPHVISIIGTRGNSEYGKQITEQLVQALKPLPILVVSGLAYGIDAIAHRAALQKQLPTVGVLAHGLDTLYPMQHRSLAKEMLHQGGLLTEFRQHTKPDKHNFPRRNRIVAGMADATIVIETAVKGGSMITAELAHQYNRDVFAVPGRITDTKSSGCLQLIRQHKAMLFTGADALLDAMGWLPKKNTVKKQKELFPELSANGQLLLALMQQKETTHIAEVNSNCVLSNSAVAAALLELEMNHLILSLPGNRYRTI